MNGMDHRADLWVAIPEYKLAVWYAMEGDDIKLAEWAQEQLPTSIQYFEVAGWIVQGAEKISDVWESERVERSLEKMLRK